MEGVPPAKSSRDVQEPPIDTEWRMTWKVFIRDHMLNSGLDLRRLAAALCDELNANKRSSTYDKELKDWVYSEWEPDWTVRQAARRDALKIFGINTDRQSMTNVNVNVDEKTLTVVSDLNDAEKMLSKLIEIKTQIDGEDSGGSG